MTIHRDRHWTDIEIEGPGRSRRRRIRNHINYRTPGGLFLPAQANIQAQGAPPDWSGQWDFRDHSGAAALQFSAHDSTDPFNRAMIGIRIDDTPDVWVNHKAMDVVSGIETVSPDAITREWPGLWANSTLRWRHAGHIVQKEIELSAPGHPASFRFSSKTSPGASWSVENGIFAISQGGVQKMVTRPVYGTDANGNYIRATLTLDDTWGPGGAYPILRITPNADDLATATYPVTLDPTTTIDDTGIEDNYLRSSSFANLNYGAAQSWGCIASSINGLCRLDDTLIPAGTITATDLTYTVIGTRTWDLDLFKVESANAGWVEGTSNGSAETGASCWNYRAYNTTNWAGSAGCNTSGTDYVADASPPNSVGVSESDGTLTVFPVKNEWTEDWRDNPSNNGGLITIGNSGSGFWVSVDNTSRPVDKPYCDITYTVASGQPAFIRWTPVHVAGKAGLFRGKF